LEIPVGAGPAAFGSAYTALANDAYAPVWNPAGLGFLESTQLAGQHLAYLESMNYEFVGLVHPLRKGDAVGVSAQYLTSGDIPATDLAGQSFGSYSDTFGAYSLAYGHAFSERFSLGLTGKVIHLQLEDVSANAYAADLGAFYVLNAKWHLAATIANLGTKITFLKAGNSLPRTVHLAAAYRLTSAWTVAAEAAAPTAGTLSARLGVEWRPLDLIALRAGYRTDTLKELSALAGFSTGIGVQVWGKELAYAWVPYGELGNTQYLSLVWRFGALEQRDRNLIQYRSLNSRRSIKEQGLDSMDPETQQLMQLLNEKDKKEQLGQTPNEQKPENDH
jgi:hypothetical protein